MDSDQLERNERIRLEALNQAVALNMGCAVSDEQVLSVAKHFELWIRHGTDRPSQVERDDFAGGTTA